MNIARKPQSAKNPQQKAQHIARPSAPAGQPKRRQQGRSIAARGRFLPFIILMSIVLVLTALLSFLRRRALKTRRGTGGAGDK